MRSDGPQPAPLRGSCEPVVERQNRIRRCVLGGEQHAAVGHLQLGLGAEHGQSGRGVVAERDLNDADDTIDDEGLLFVVSHDPRGAALATALAARLGTVGLPVRTRRLPLGILVDSLPLARAGAAAVTVGRLTWRTLRVIHTPADVPEGLSLEAAERVGRALA